MNAATKDLPGLEEGIAVLEGLIAEGSCLIMVRRDFLIEELNRR